MTLSDLEGHFVITLSLGCIIGIYIWFCAKRLQLNADNTELLWFGPASQPRRLPSHNNSINVNQCIVKPVTVIRVVRRRAINALARFSGDIDMFLPSAPNTCRSKTARPRRYSKTSYSTFPVTSGILQRRAGQSSSFHAGTVPASPACSGTHRSGSQAA